MKRRDWLAKWGLYSLKLKAPFMEAQFDQRATDSAAAWDLYVELLTRITSQHPPPDDGDEETALDTLTSEILCKHGSGCGEFAIPVFNQIISCTLERHLPFLPRRHALSGRQRRYCRIDLAGCCRQGRNDLASLIEWTNHKFVTITPAITPFG